MVENNLIVDKWLWLKLNDILNQSILWTIATYINRLISLSVSLESKAYIYSVHGFLLLNYKISNVHWRNE